MAVSCKVDGVTRDGPRPQVRACPAVGASGLVFSCPASHGSLANPLESQAKPPAALGGRFVSLLWRPLAHSFQSRAVGDRLWWMVATHEESEDIAGWGWAFEKADKNSPDNGHTDTTALRMQETRLWELFHL